MRRQVASRSIALAAVLCTLVASATTGVATASTPDGSGSSPARCGGGLRAVGDGFCTHGGDLVPGSVQRLLARPLAVLGPSVGDLCVGNGVKGRRIRVYYSYPSDTAPHASAYRAGIRESVATADASLDGRTPGVDGQHLRMYCRSDRAVTVSAIPLLPIGADNTYTFDDVITSLVDRVDSGLGSANIDDPRFTYVVFVDNVTCCYGPAGQGTVYWDDRPDPDRNFNNRVGWSPRFAMVELRGDIVADAFVFLHEVGHTIGAVQVSAPHSTGAGHCYTMVDVMCSADDGSWFTGGGTMGSVCPQPPVGVFTFDCEGGDYYEVHPPQGSYLRSHWNTANSGWLTKPA